MTTNTKSAHERTASIDLAKLERLIAELKAAELMDDQCGHALLQGHGVLMDLAWLKRVVDFASRSLTSGTPAEPVAGDVANTEQIWAWFRQSSSFGPWIECHPDEDGAVKFVSASGTGSTQAAQAALARIEANGCPAYDEAWLANVLAAGSAQQADTKGAALDGISTEQLLMIIGDNTPGRINLNLGDLDMYLRVASAAITADRRKQSALQALYDAGQEEASTQTVPSIGSDADFMALLHAYRNTTTDFAEKKAALIAYIDGRITKETP